MVQINTMISPIYHQVVAHIEHLIILNIVKSSKNARNADKNSGTQVYTYASLFEKSAVGPRHPSHLETELNTEKVKVRL